MAYKKVVGLDGLNERQRLAAWHLSRGKTCRAVARELGISERCLYKWRQSPAVQQVIAKLQTEFMEETGAMNSSMVPDAIQVLNEIISKDDARDSDKIAAARTLMSGSQAYQERVILQRQIADLERQLLATVMNDGSVPTQLVEALDPLLPSANPDD